MGVSMQRINSRCCSLPTLLLGACESLTDIFMQ